MPFRFLTDALRDARWFGAERAKAYCLILVAVQLLGLFGLVATSHGFIAADGQPLGSDFSQVYVAGLSVDAGAPTAPYDNVLHAAHQKAVFGPTAPFYPWGYPPIFLLAAGLLALLPYPAALAVWQASGLAAYLALLRKIFPHPLTLLASIAFPAVFINLTHGQNGFATAVLLGAGAALLPGRPALAGLCFGLLAYKPQFGVLIPLALVACGAWRAILSAAAAASAAMAASIVLYGAETWRAFFGSLAFSRQVVIEQGGSGWEKMQSVFAAIRALGGSIPLAYAAQAVSAFACALVVIWLYRRRDYALGGAALLTGALLSTPYCMDYDMLALAPALALLARIIRDRGALPYEKTAMLCAFIAPLISRPVGMVAPVPLGLLAMIGLMAAIIRRGRATSPACEAAPVVARFA